MYAGTSYMVGEKGPELFTPGTSGMISPHGAARGEIVIYQDNRGADPASANRLARIGRQMAVAASQLAMAQMQDAQARS